MARAAVCIATAHVTTHRQTIFTWPSRGCSPRKMNSAQNVSIINPEDVAPDAARLNTEAMEIDEANEAKPKFAPASAQEMAPGKQLRRVPIPPHRMTPLKEKWMKIYTPLVEHMHLQVRFNLKTRNVEIRTSKDTVETSSIQKAADFVRAFALGFDIEDAISLLRLEDLFIDSFEIKDVKTLNGDHLSRAIGRIAGKGGKTKFTIENASRTRIVVADTKIHILGSYQNIRVAKDAIVCLIMGSPPGKVTSTLRTVSARMRERF